MISVCLRFRQEGYNEYEWVVINIQNNVKQLLFFYRHTPDMSTCLNVFPFVFDVNSTLM